MNKDLKYNKYWKPYDEDFNKISDKKFDTRFAIDRTYRIENFIHRTRIRFVQYPHASVLSAFPNIEVNHMFVSVTTFYLPWIFKRTSRYLEPRAGNVFLNGKRPSYIYKIISKLHNSLISNYDVLLSVKEAEVKYNINLSENYQLLKLKQKRKDKIKKVYEI